jgi:hypothetical protein
MRSGGEVYIKTSYNVRSACTYVSLSHPRWEEGTKEGVRKKEERKASDWKKKESGGKEKEARGKPGYQEGSFLPAPDIRTMLPSPVLDWQGPAGKSEERGGVYCFH